MSLLSASNITVNLHDATLVEDVSLDVTAGEVVAIIGPNGAGKTSLVRALTGELSLTSGEVIMNSKRLSDYSLVERARQLALLAQQTELNFPFTVSDVVHLGRIPHASGKLEDDDIVDEVLDAVDMSERAERLYTWLSGGEQQRVQLARVMAQVWRSDDAPVRLMILDEPTASLDISHTRQLMRVIRRQAEKNLGVIMIVHDFNLAATYADRIVVLKQGKLVAEGSPGDVITEANMQQFFDVSTRIVAHPDNGRPLVFIDE